MGKKQYGKKFSRARNRSKAVNSPNMMPRGGFRF